MILFRAAHVLLLFLMYDILCRRDTPFFCVLLIFVISFIFQPLPQIVNQSLSQCDEPSMFAFYSVLLVVCFSVIVTWFEFNYNV